MNINIPGDLPTTLVKVLYALTGVVVNIDGRDVVVRSAVEREDHGVNLIANPWDEDNDGPLLQETLIIPLDQVEKIEVP